MNDNVFYCKHGNTKIESIRHFFNIWKTIIGSYVITQGECIYINLWFWMGYIYKIYIIYNLMNATTTSTATAAAATFKALTILMSRNCWFILWFVCMFVYFSQLVCHEPNATFGRWVVCRQICLSALFLSFSLIPYKRQHRPETTKK